MQYGTMQSVNIDLIDTNPNQPRKSFKGVEGLAKSIKEKGFVGFTGNG